MGNTKDVKKKRIAEIVEALGKAKVIAVVDLNNLPAKLLHSVRKELKGKATVIIYKTALLKRAIRIAKKDKLLEYLKGEKALLLSDMDPFKLYKKANAFPLKVYAKAGQIAPFDIIVPEGETSLAPGPVLTELKQAGIDARIQSGKITVAKDSLVASKGEEIKDAVAKALQKLDIKPFEVTMGIPVALEGDVVYLEEVMNVKPEEFMADLSLAFMGANSLSIELGYPTQFNIKELLATAFRKAKHIGREKSIMVPGMVEELVKKASLEAAAINAKVGSS